ncbi:MAG TPA: zinc-binding alcohol dehydrogenase family protein [Puia sp.]|nr:zinc-binding alcohol dehydrogenase family protein [Puia sp.]
MKVLSCIAPEKLEYQTMAMPSPAEGHTILKIKSVGVCGTDLHSFRGTQPYFSYPRVLGHELSGIIVETDRSDFQKDELVTILPYFNCGICVACRMGKPNCCASLQVAGIHVDGGMAEYFSVPSNCLVHAQGLDEEALALVEPFAIGAHAIKRAGIQPNDFVLISGAGPIGLTLTAFAKMAGAHVIVLDINHDRLRFCTEQLQLAHALDAKDENLFDQIRMITSGNMPQVVIDATGNQKAINGLFQYMSHGGKYILVGLQKENICFSHPEFHKREATLMSSRNATREDFDQVIQVMRQKSINPDIYITHRIPFEKAKNDFGSLLDPANRVIKAMIRMDERES